MPLVAPDMAWGAILPEIVLSAGALLLIVVAAARATRPGLASGLSLLVLAGAALAVAASWARPAGESFAGMMTGDPLSLFATLVFVVAAALTVLLSIGEPRGHRAADYYALLLFAASGMSLMAASTDLVSFLLSLELLSISLYVLMGLDTRRPGATEAAMKYFLLGAFASAFAIYGTALIYGAVGSTHFATIAAVAPGLLAHRDLLAFAGLALLTVGLGFKISMVPFHAWTPDVYQGAATPLVGFLSTGSKAAVFVVLIRVFGDAFGGLRVSWVGLLAALAFLTMTVGNITALRQLDLKRLLAFSSVAHVGYLLSGIAAAGPDGASGVLFYLAGYTAMNLTAFGVVAWLERERGHPIALSDFSGLGQRSPLLAAGMSVALFSLAGVPPTVGFVGKLYLFRAAVRADLTWLAVAGVLNSVVSLYYYLRIVVYMYMRPAETADSPARTAPLRDLAARLALGVSTALILVLGVFPNSLLRLAEAAAALLS